MVADLTGRNSNVYFEAGLAEAWDKKWILIAQSKDDVSFDIQHIRAIYYKNTPGGLTELGAQLQNAMRDTLRY